MTVYIDGKNHGWFIDVYGVRQFAAVILCGVFCYGVGVFCGWMEWGRVNS